MKKVHLLIGLILTLSLSGCGKNLQPQPASGNSMSAFSQPSVSGQTTDLVFYGETALWLEKGNGISVDLEALDYYDALDRVCVFNIKDILIKYTDGSADPDNPILGSSIFSGFCTYSTRKRMDMAVK